MCISKFKSVHKRHKNTSTIAFPFVSLHNPNPNPQNFQPFAQQLNWKSTFCCCFNYHDFNMFPFFFRPRSEEFLLKFVYGAPRLPCWLFVSVKFTEIILLKKNFVMKGTEKAIKTPKETMKPSCCSVEIKSTWKLLS